MKEIAAYLAAFLAIICFILSVKILINKEAKKFLAVQFCGISLFYIIHDFSEILGLPRIFYALTGLFVTVMILGLVISISSSVEKRAGSEAEDTGAEFAND